MLSAIVHARGCGFADNPETLKGHEGHYVPAEAYVYLDKNLIRITEVKIPTARESREADIK
jgi:hypothetical protein